MDLFIGALVIIFIAIILYLLVIFVVEADYNLGHIVAFSIILVLVILSCKTFIRTVI